MTDPFVWLAVLAVPGHISWLQWCSNNLHATGLDYRLVKRVSPLINTVIAGGAIALVLWAALRCVASASPLPPWAQLYVGVCVVNTLVSFLPWLVVRLTWRDPEVLLSDTRVLRDFRDETGPQSMLTRKGRLLTALPGNQSFQLAVQTKRLLIPRLPPALDGLRIAHISDLHLAAVFDRRFYELIAAAANEADVDLALLTGDLIEKEHCWDWIPTTLGALRAKHGAYFVFGNHDIRIDFRQTSRRLEAAGLVDVGRRLAEVPIRGVDVLIAGNELPWLGPPPRVPIRARYADAPQLRILLTHSPDQYAWARERDFDLVLAGHVHGGQIQFPILGPVLAPSKFGVRYASGTFHEPPTIMHVSRGTSAKLPLRFFCPPELTILELTAPKKS